MANEQLVVMSWLMRQSGGWRTSCWTGPGGGQAASARRRLRTAAANPTRCAVIKGEAVHARAQRAWQSPRHSSLERGAAAALCGGCGAGVAAVGRGATSRWLQRGAQAQASHRLHRTLGWRLDPPICLSATDVLRLVLRCQDIPTSQKRAGDARARDELHNSEA